jgi:hypothetical protein
MMTRDDEDESSVDSHDDVSAGVKGEEPSTETLPSSEKRGFQCSRWVVVAVLLTAAAVLGAVTYVVVDNEEDGEEDDRFNSQVSL